MSVLAASDLLRYFLSKHCRRQMSRTGAPSPTAKIFNLGSFRDCAGDDAFFVFLRSVMTKKLSGGKSFAARLRWGSSEAAACQFEFLNPRIIKKRNMSWKSLKKTGNNSYVSWILCMLYMGANMRQSLRGKHVDRQNSMHN